MAKFDFDMVAMYLAAIGALNWGLIELVNLNLLEVIPLVNSMPGIASILIGFSGGWLLYKLIKK